MMIRSKGNASSAPDQPSRAVSRNACAITGSWQARSRLKHHGRREASAISSNSDASGDRVLPGSSVGKGTPPFREARRECEHVASKRLELRASAQPLLMKRSRNGLSTKRANPTTTKFKMAVNTNTKCQPPLADLMRLATGTRKADAPLAV